MNDWIPCSEKMPEKDGRYIVYEHHNAYGWIGVCALRHGKWDIVNVTHWMELPSSPIEEKNV